MAVWQILPEARSQNCRDEGKKANCFSIFVCDFYVLGHLVVPVILSSTLLYGTDAFMAYGKHFDKGDVDDQSRPAGVCTATSRKSLSQAAGEFFHMRPTTTTCEYS
jgi:hypothetical protein